MALDVDTRVGDVGKTSKDNTTNSGNSTQSEFGTHKDTHLNSDNKTEIASPHDDHSQHNVYIGVPPPAAPAAAQAAPQGGGQAAHDPAPHEAAAVHHSGPHPDPTVLALQERLLANGFDPGSLDGIMGPRTEAALAAEQAFWAHQQQAGHGGYGEQAPHHHGGYEGHGYDHGTPGGYDHQGYPHGGYEEHHHGVHGGYGHEGYLDGEHEAHGYYHGAHQGYGAAEMHEYDPCYGYQEADQVAYQGEAYEVEAAEAAW